MTNTHPKVLPDKVSDSADSDLVFQTAAELFSLLSTPVRLKILSALCDGEKNVTQLLAEIGTTQPNLSQHLAALYRAGILGKRREGTQIFYRVINPNAVAVCRNVCSQVAIDLDQN
jgi:DNA-binding transcriptional ArsR family regulator